MKKKSNKVLVLPGTHDIKDIYYFIKNNNITSKNKVFYFKLHPKNKFYFKKDQINKILKEHKENISNYCLNSRKVINKFSPKNPDNINAYKKILSSLLDE